MWEQTVLTVPREAAEVTEARLPLPAEPEAAGVLCQPQILIPHLPIYQAAQGAPADTFLPAMRPTRTGLADTRVTRALEAMTAEREPEAAGVYIRGFAIHTACLRRENRANRVRTESKEAGETIQ